ncbi:MAG: hypothetical protein E7390_06855 [Ruminococcaceae bacterium]|nr:hypothetical protein [Oscillospiraceae bacterium]
MSSIRFTVPSLSICTGTYGINIRNSASIQIGSSCRASISKRKASCIFCTRIRVSASSVPSEKQKVSHGLSESEYFGEPSPVKKERGHLPSCMRSSTSENSSFNILRNLSTRQRSFSEENLYPTASL